MCKQENRTFKSPSVHQDLSELKAYRFKVFQAEYFCNEKYSNVFLLNPTTDIPGTPRVAPS